jgi:hypothetical protein
VTTTPPADGPQSDCRHRWSSGVCLNCLAEQADEPQFTSRERAVWDAWNALPDDAARPVHTIAARLGLAPADVAFIVYPVETFGRWSDDDE